MKRLLALCLLLACAHAEPTARRHTQLDPEDELAADRQELARLERELGGTNAEGRPVDCSRATQLGDNVCLLSERICALVAGLPRDPGHTAQCTDARTRCAAARQRVKAACGK